MTPDLFLDSLFGATEHNVNLRAIDSSKRLPTKETFVRGSGEILRFAGQYRDHYNIYFGLATRNGGGGKEHIREIVTLHADIDFKLTPREAAVKLLASFPLSPTFIVETGGGLHVYWMLREVSGPEDIQAVEAINRGLARVLGGDKGATDASRILRVPGTWNRKPEYGAPRPVRVLESHPDRRYNLSDFAAFAEPGKAPTSPSKPSGELLPIERLARVVERCQAVARILKRAKEERHLSHPERIALANLYLAFEGGREWATGRVFSKLSDFDAAYTEQMFDSLCGKPPRCENDGLCAGTDRCAAILAAGGQSPIKFAYVESSPEAETGSLAFPLSVMTGAAGAFAKLYADYLEPPEQFFFMSYLTCLGSFVADKLTLASEIAPQPRLYTILLGESADDRKSTAANKTVEFFRETTVNYAVCHGVGSAEGLQKRLEKENRLLLVLDEFKSFVSKCKIESSVLLPCVNTLFESNRYESRTKTSEVVLESAYLSLLAASTIPTWENTWSSAFTDIGFVNRLFLVPGGARRAFSFPAKIPEGERTRLKRELQDVLTHIRERGELDLTPEAKALYHEWYMGREGGIHAKRLDVYALRLMTLLAVNDLKRNVDEDTVRKAIALCDHQYRVRILHDPIDADSEVAKMEEKIRRVLTAKGELSERDLKKALHTERTGLWVYTVAMKNLQVGRDVTYIRNSKRYSVGGGR